jgi:hypothetical protein
MCSDEVLGMEAGEEFVRAIDYKRWGGAPRAPLAAVGTIVNLAERHGSGGLSLTRFR